MAGPGAVSGSGGSNILCLPIDNSQLGQPGNMRTPSTPGGGMSVIHPIAYPQRSGQRAIPAESGIYCNLCIIEDRHFHVSQQRQHILPQLFHLLRIMSL